MEQTVEPTPKKDAKPKLVAAISVVLTDDNKMKISVFPRDNKELVTDMIYNAFKDMDFKHVCFDAVIRETNEIEEMKEEREKILDPHGKIYTEKDKLN